MADVIAFQCGRLALPYKPEAAQGVTPEALATSCREEYDPDIVPAEAGVLIGAVDVQDNRLEAEVTAWGVAEVGSREDASEIKGWGSHEFRGLAHEGRNGIGSDDGGWNIAASTATPATRTFGSNWPNSWRPRGVTRPGRCFAP